MCVCVCACACVCGRGGDEWGSGVCVHAHMLFCPICDVLHNLDSKGYFMLCVDCFQMTCPHGSNKSVNPAVPKPHLEIQSKHTSRT